ncbi:MAG: hypothetical protein ACYC0B_02635 [Gemmatimonadaceae bacterium]
MSVSSAPVPPTDASPAVVPAVALRRELVRKAVHLGSVALPVGWAYGVLSPDTLVALLTVALASAVLVEGARHLSPAVARVFGVAFGPLLRPHERVELTGATWLAAAMLAAVIILPPRAGIIALWAAAAADGLASVVGRLVTYWRRRPAVGKTIIGSITCASVTMAGALWLAGTTWPVAAAIGTVTALAERPRGPLDDNLRVALAAGLAAWGLGVA